MPSIAAQCLEATFIDLTAEDEWISNLNAISASNYDAISIGMGLGREIATSAFTRQVLKEAKVPVVVDADGLSQIKDDLSILRSRPYPTIVKPHPGEMAMLLNCLIADNSCCAF